MSKLNALENRWRSTDSQVCGSAQKILCRLAVLFVLSMICSSSYAQNDAYSIQVAVVDRSSQEQQNAYQVGMRSVLLANSGDKTLLNRDDVRAGLGDADTYVESFRYDSPTVGTTISRSTPMTDAVRSSGKATQLMFIQFNRELINELIRPGNAAEPETQEEFDRFANVTSALMWIIVEDGGRQMLISAAEGQNVMERAREIAGGLGISLSFPAGDATDAQAVAIDDIKTANLERVSAAALRYAQPVTLAAHVTRTRSGSWEGVWMKMAAGEKQNQAYSSKSLDDALQLGISWLGAQDVDSAPTQSNFQPGTSSASSSAEGLLWISPLRTTKNYSEVMSFLSSIEGVDAVYPKEVLSSGMVFAVLPRSALSTVGRAAGTKDWLRQSNTPSSASESRFAAGISVAFEYLR